MRDGSRGGSPTASDAFSEPPPAATAAIATPTPFPATPLDAPHTPSTNVFHALWSFAPTNHGHGFGAGGLGDQYALPFGFGAGMHNHMDNLMGSPADETMYWDNFDLAPNDLLGMSMRMSMSHDVNHDVGVDFEFNVDDPMQQQQQQHLGSEREPVVLPRPAPALAALSPALSPAAVASGHKAYQRSPWLFDPVAQDHAYAESQALSVDERMLERQLRAESTGVQQQQRQVLPLPRPMDATARDAILAMAIAFSKTTGSFPSFPSCDLLDVFVNAYFVREAARPDPWIHAPTLHADEGDDTNRCRTELLVALVAGGATLFAPPKVWKMGLALQEIVKLAIRSAVDNDNRLTRNLQVFQAFVLWVEIALWSGHRRKMEIGEGFASSIITVSVVSALT